MSSFEYRTITTRVFNQPKSFEACGYIDEEGEIFLTELYAVGHDKLGKPKLSCVNCLLDDQEINAAIVSLLNEWPNGLIFNQGSKK